MLQSSSNVENQESGKLGGKILISCEVSNTVEKIYLIQTSNVEVEVPSITVQASKLECEIINIIN